MRVPVMVWITICVSWSSVEAEDYKYPYRDPYLATITTAILNADGLTPGLHRQVVRVPVLRDRNQLPSLEGRGELSVALYRQGHRAPLLFILSGIGSSPYFGASTYFASLFHRKGFHVVILPSPMTWNFALAASRSGAPGYVPEDARDLYDAMQATLLALRTRYRVDISRIDFMGVSLGALEGAYLSVIDARERKIGIEKYLLASPPADLTYALRKIDDMEAQKDRIGRDRSERVIMKALAIAEPFTEERRDDPAVFDKLVRGFSRFTTEELQFLIAEYLQSVLAELVYVTQVVHDQNILAAAKEKVRRRLHEAKGFTFRDYSEKIGLPIWRLQAGEPRADLESFTKRGSLAPILDQLRGNRKVYILHNADDFLAERKSIEELKEAMGEQMTVYPYGGHLGNLWYSETKEYVLGLFGGAP